MFGKYYDYDDFPEDERDIDNYNFKFSPILPSSTDVEPNEIVGISHSDEGDDYFEFETHNDKWSEETIERLHRVFGSYMDQIGSSIYIYVPPEGMDKVFSPNKLKLIK